MTDVGERPFFSVIVPAYNAEGRIHRLLDSVKAQTFRDYELIVVCDSCEDNTCQIAKNYGARTAEVSYGLDGLTRNAGLDMAKGEWVLFADDDDWYMDEHCFQTIADAARSHDADAIFFGYVNAKTGYVRQSPESFGPQCWNKCWRRSFIGGTRFSYRKYWSDADFHNKMLRKPHRFYCIEDPIYYYNFMRAGSVSERLGRDDLSASAKFGPVNIITSDEHFIKEEQDAEKA